jgi:hypothetical protein
MAGLALLLGAGMAFGLWYVLHNSPATGMAGAAVAALAMGMGLVGLGLNRPMGRVFLVVTAVALALTFFTASGAFAAVSS